MSAMPPDEMRLVRLSGPPISAMADLLSAAHLCHAAMPSFSRCLRSASGSFCQLDMASGEPVKTARNFFMGELLGSGHQSRQVGRNRVQLSPAFRERLAKYRFLFRPGIVYGKAVN